MDQPKALLLGCPRQIMVCLELLGARGVVSNKKRRNCPALLRCFLVRRVGWLRAHLVDPVSSRGGTALPQGLCLEVSRVELGALRATVCNPAGSFSRVLVNGVQQVLVQPES